MPLRKNKSFEVYDKPYIFEVYDLITFDMRVCDEITMIKVIYTFTHLKHVLYLFIDDVLGFPFILMEAIGKQPVSCSITCCFSLLRQGLSVNLALS